MDHTRYNSVTDGPIMNAIRDLIADPTGDESFFVADLGDVIGKIQLWQQKLPRVRPFYAVKANSDPLLIQLMQTFGTGFDCASKAEIELVLSIGGKAKDIVFAHTQKLMSHLTFAAEKGVDLMTFDCENELHKIKKFFPNARLLLRFQIPNVASKYDLSEKFGCCADESFSLLDKAYELGLNVVGVAFHVGSMCNEPSAYTKAISVAKDIQDYAEKLGFQFSILDIGGGFPGHLGTYHLFDEMCQEISKALELNFPDADKIRVIAEPGNYFVNSAFTFCATVVGKKLVPEDIHEDGFSKKQKIMYYLNDGRYGSLPWYWQEYGAEMQFLSEDGKPKTGQKLPSKVWGCTCCSTDSVLNSALLPELDIGDHIVINNMGSYMLCVASNFNGFGASSVHYVCTTSPQSAGDYRNFLDQEKLNPDEFSFSGDSRFSISLQKKIHRTDHGREMKHYSSGLMKCQE